MKAAAHLTFSREGFDGYVYEPANPGNRCIIVLAGDTGRDFLCSAFARWLTRQENTAALCMTLLEPGKPGGVHSWPLEYIEKAIRWLHDRNYRKIGILGLSMQAVIALSAAARFPELSLTVALAPADFVPWGFYQEQGKEWPSGTSLLSFRGEDLPWQPACLEKEEYWELYVSEKKKYGEIHAVSVFRHSENASPVPDACRIPVEQIRGKLVLVGAEDDSMWDSVPYIRRMEKRLKAFPDGPDTRILTYPVGTHLLVPERLLIGAIPLLGHLIFRMFASGRANPGACKQAALDLDRQLTEILKNW